MVKEIIKFLSVALLSTLQYKVAMLSALSISTWSVGVQIAAVMLGYLSCVFVVCFFEEKVRKGLNWINQKVLKRKTSFKKKRKFVRVFKKYGVWGLGFFSPITVGALIGSTITVAMGGHKKETLLAFTVGCVFWTTLLGIFGDMLLTYFKVS